MGLLLPLRPARRSATAGAAVGLAAALLCGAAPAQAVALAPVPLGVDVGYPQCGTVLPAAQAFAVVGVNGGTATTANPCLADQLAWAAGSVGGAGRPAVEVYVNTANPGPLLASWWPSGNRTRRGVAVHPPVGRCSGTASIACAYVYGYSIAADDLEQRGVPAGAVARWWLDVEVANTWSPSTTRNRTVLEGMTARITATGAKVGLYALDHEFRDLIGPVPTASPIARLPSWLAGTGDAAAASRRCTKPALVQGRTLLAQAPGAAGGIDQDVACQAFTAAARPSIHGDHGVGDRLTAKVGAWRPGPVTLAFRWLRDGHPIAKATGRTHRIVRADVGHRITVTVTGTRDGFSRTAVTSRSIATHR